MSSATGKPIHSAAWRISLWGTLAFACGTLVVFLSLHRLSRTIFSGAPIHGSRVKFRRLGDVAERTPKNALYGRVVGEIAELASREIPNRPPKGGAERLGVLSADGS